MAQVDAKLMLALVREKVRALKAEVARDKALPDQDQVYLTGQYDALIDVLVALCNIERDLGW